MQKKTFCQSYEKGAELGPPWTSWSNRAFWLAERVSEIYFKDGVIYGEFERVNKVIKLKERYICDQEAYMVLLNLIFQHIQIML